MLHYTNVLEAVHTRNQFGWTVFSASAMSQLWVIVGIADGDNMIATMVKTSP